MARLFAAALLCLIAFPANALPCWAIRNAVALYGESAAISWAKSHGYTDKQISEAKRCLHK